MRTPKPSIRKGRSKLSLTETQARRPTELVAPAKAGRAESSALKQAMELLEKSFPAVHAVIVTTFPRGTLQLAQPAKLASDFLRDYVRQGHLDDSLTWRAILTGKAVTASEGDPYLKDFLAPKGFAHAAAAPLAEPVIDGYAGAVQLHRTAEQGPFSPVELKALSEVAQSIDKQVETSRATRQGSSPAEEMTLTPRPAVSVFAFDAVGKQIVGGSTLQKLDPALQKGLADQARARLSKIDGELLVSDRVQLHDSRGDLWTFRAVSYAHHPAADGKNATVFCLIPTCSQWAALRSSDVHADGELARLVPAMKFMRQEFHRGPTLGEIASQVRLSPFHFHRRFTEQLGLTPKHFLLDCQITQAKLDLLAREKPLSQIASDCGFAHQSHFTSRFKQATGLTPTRWRRLASEGRLAG